MTVSYRNYKGGINNLIVVSDDKGNTATSTKDLQQAIKNLKRKQRRKNNG